MSQPLPAQREWRARESDLGCWGPSDTEDIEQAGQAGEIGGVVRIERQVPRHAGAAMSRSAARRPRAVRPAIVGADPVAPVVAVL
jgi:hypothetical protein